MKIKNIIIMAIAIVVAFTACQDDEYEMPNDLSGVGWYTSNFRNDQFLIGINDFVSFSDVSQNAVSHKWTIPEGAFFLEGPISRTDSILEEYIIPNAGLETEDETVHVYFTKSGMQPVRLYNTFNEKVTFFGRDTFEAKQEGNIWVIDTTFMVDVLDTIVAEVLVRQEGVEVPLGTDTIYVEAGGSLEFVDITSIGRPNTWDWRVAGEMSTDSAATFIFKKLGVFGAALNISRSGENIPGDYDRFIVPNPIKVIPSSKPWELAGDLVELEDETIQLPFNGEFLPFMNKEEFFTVKVNDVEFAISSISINTTDATLLEIKLAEPIYRPDVITVSLAEGSGINSTDYRTPTAFSDVPVVMHDVNLLSDAGYGFEDGGLAWAALWDNEAPFEFTTEKAASGNYSVKITREGGQKSKIESKNEKFSLTGGKVYTIRYKIFIESTAGGAYGVWLLPNWKQFWQSLNDKPTGEWVTVETEWAPEADEPDRNFMIQMNGDGTFYFDDFYIVEKEERP